jgi:cell division protein FtsZ
MPSIDELPRPARSQMQAPQPEAMPPHAAEAKRMTLLQRLAAVGLGRREDEAPHEVRHQVRQEPRQEPRPEPVPMPRPVAPSPAHAEYAKRPAPQQAYRPAEGRLDQHGRQQAPNRPAEEDQLEIPAFLRRQAN